MRRMLAILVLTSLAACSANNSPDEWPTTTTSSVSATTESSATASESAPATTRTSAPVASKPMCSACSMPSHTMATCCTNPAPVAAEAPAEAATQPAETPDDRPMTIYVAGANSSEGEPIFRVKNWDLQMDDLPALVKMYKPTSALITGAGSFKTALQIKSILQANGVSRTTIDLQPQDVSAH